MTDPTATIVSAYDDRSDAAAELLDDDDFAAELREFLPGDRLFDFQTLPPFPHPLKHPLRASSWLIQMAFGIASLIVLLAVIAAIPIVNLLALGYLLAAEGRVARTGRLRHAFPLLPLAPRLGSIALGVWVFILPLRLLASAASDAQLIAPGSTIAAAWNVAVLLTAAGVAVHLCLALARGGGFWCFVRPIKNIRWLWARLQAGDYWHVAAEAVGDFVAALRLGHHFWLGTRGLVGALVWLLVPTALFGALNDTSKPGQVLLTLFGGLCLVLVLSWAPFLQARFAAENRWRAMFELRSIRRLFRKAPLAWFIAVVLLYVLSLPLYLFKVVLPPDDAMWGVTLVFIVTIYPAKILIGWAYHRAAVRRQPAWFGFRWMTRAALLPLLAVYLFLLFFTPAIGEHGRRVLFEHHALLLPVPF